MTTGTGPGAARRPSGAWVSQSEAMALLGVSRGTIARRWARQGRLAATPPAKGRRYDIGPLLVAGEQARVCKGDATTRPPRGWVLLDDAADELRLAKFHLREAAVAGELDVRRHRSRIILRRSQLEVWIESRRVQPGAGA